MYKSKLQELCHKRSWNLPVYSTQRDGPDHCPVFTTTLTLNNFEFSSPKNGSKSSKEAQNAAAKIAFDYFSLPADYPHHHQLLNPSSYAKAPSPPSPPSVSSSPLSASSSKLVTGAPHNPHNQQVGNVDISPRHNDLASSNKDIIEPMKNDVLQQNHGVNVQCSTPKASSNKDVIEPMKNDVLQQNHGVNMQCSTPKDLLHVYKNKLQHFAQKNSISLPAYSYEFVGLPHARRFKANVMVNGITYQSPDYYSTLKDAEHAAAKAALEALSIPEIPENEGLSKSLLQELAQKMGFSFRSYSTVRSGPSHMSTFVSTVEVGGISYEGVGCKTKKQAETSAARVAYEKLRSGNDIYYCPPVSTLSKNAEVPCHGLQPANINNCQPIAAKITPKNHRKRAPDSQVSNIKRKFPPSDEMNIHPAMLSCGSDGKEFSSPHLDSKSPQNILPKLAPMVKEAKLDGVEVKSEEARPTEGGEPQERILIFRRGSYMEIPEGAVELPHQDDEWVAMKVSSRHDQKV